MQAEKELSREQIYSGDVFDIVKLQVQTEDNFIQERDLLLHHGGSCILALNAKQEIYLVKQYRVAVGDFSYELPAGKLEAGEDPKVCAYRELEEECGLKANKLDKLLDFYPTPGYSNEIIYAYYTDDFDIAQQNLDAGEVIEVYQVSLAEAVNMIYAGKIKDAKTIVSIFYVWNKLMHK